MKCRYAKQASLIRDLRLAHLVWSRVQRFYVLHVLFESRVSLPYVCFEGGQRTRERVSEHVFGVIANAFMHSYNHSFVRLSGLSFLRSGFTGAFVLQVERNQSILQILS